MTSADGLERAAQRKELLAMAPALAKRAWERGLFSLKDPVSSVSAAAVARDNGKYAAVCPPERTVEVRGDIDPVSLKSAVEGLAKGWAIEGPASMRYRVNSLRTRLQEHARGGVYAVRKVPRKDRVQVICLREPGQLAVNGE